MLQPMKLYIFGNFEGTRPLGNLRHWWANCNMEMDFQEMWCEGEGSLLVTVGRAEWWELMNVVMNLWLPCKAVSVLTGCATGDMCKIFISTWNIFLGGRFSK